MNLIEAALTQVAGDLRALGHRWALVGGFAVSIRADPRFTRDVDVAVAVTDDVSAEAVIRELTERSYRLIATVEQEATGRLATARLIPPFARGGEVVVDLLFASSGVEPELVAGAELLAVLPDLSVPVARVGDLIALKILARDDESRPQDAADLRALLGVASSADLERAEALLLLVALRGFDRGRDLPAALAALRERS